MKSELDKLKYYKFNLNNFLLSNICKYRIHERDAEKVIYV